MWKFEMYYQVQGNRVFRVVKTWADGQTEPEYDGICVKVCPDRETAVQMVDMLNITLEGQRIWQRLHEQTLEEVAVS
jgi:hypothetical protein